MACTKRAFYLLTVLTVAGYLSPNAADAQAPPYVAVTTNSLKTFAQQLKQDLQDGSVLLADLRAIQLRLALRGVLKQELSDDIDILERRPEPDQREPQLTAGLMPVADKLIEALNERNLELAKSIRSNLLHRYTSSMNSIFGGGSGQQAISTRTDTSTFPFNWRNP